MPFVLPKRALDPDDVTERMVALVEETHVVSFRGESAPDVHYAPSASLAMVTRPVAVVGTSPGWRR